MLGVFSVFSRECGLILGEAISSCYVQGSLVSTFLMYSGDPLGLLCSGPNASLWAPAGPSLQRVPLPAGWCTVQVRVCSDWPVSVPSKSLL